ncbi:MAG: flippase-like domain-containing protein [Saprospiraceae bacterium]|nr:flippase-like domain-containing protein [Saprospiraceae bacterium]
MPAQLKNVLKLLLFLGIGISIMYYLYTQNQLAYLEHCKKEAIPAEQCNLLQKLTEDFRQLNYFWISLIFVGFAMTNYSRAKRWQIILETMEYRTRFANAYSSIFIAYLANLGFPRIGEFVRAGVFSKQENIPFDKVFGSVVLDRIADMITFSLLVLLAFALDWNTFQIFFTKFASLPGVHVNGLLLGIVILAFFALWLLRESLLKLKVIQKMIQVLDGIWEGVKSIRNLQKRNAFIFHTIMIWVWFFLMFVFACKAYQATSGLNFVQMLVVYVFGSFGVFIPSPGGMGTFHYLVIVSLGLYGIHQADAFSFANIAFTWGQFLALLVFGTASLIWVNWKTKSGIPSNDPK